MEEIYGKYEISYDEMNNRFTARIGDSSYSNADLSKVRKHIDDLDKKDFVRMLVFTNQYSNGFDPKIVTSEFIEHGRKYCWITSPKTGRREKQGIQYLYADNPENVKIIEEIESLEKEKKEISLKIQVKMASLEIYKSQIKE
jgi:uncharacterized protein (UPF0335 family)